MKNQFSQEEILRMFYICGAVIFLIVGIANTCINFISWDKMLLSMKVSSGFMNLFNYVLAVFFFFLLKGMKPKIKPLEEESVDEILEEV